MKDEALRLALEALKTCQIDGDGWSGPHYDFDNKKVGKAIAAIRQALEQPEPEPVAWADMAYARLGMVRDKMHPDDVATVQRFLEGDYTSPPKRAPLTEEQIFACENNVPDAVVSDRDWCIYFARAIEAAHGIKGGA